MVPNGKAQCRAQRLPWLRWAWVVLAVVWVTARPASAQEEGPADPAATRQYAAAAALQNREEFELAIEEWKTFIADYASDSRVDRAWYYLGLCYLKVQDNAGAEAAFSQVVENFGQSKYVNASLLYLGMARFNLARAGQAEQYAKAQEAFARLIQESPKSKYVAQALFYQAECLYALGQREAAVPLYTRFIADHQDDPLLADALYALGVAQEELGQTDAAGQTYGKFLEGFSDHALAPEVSMRRGEMLFASGDYAAAAKLFAQAAASEGFVLAPLAALRHAACAYQTKDYEKAAILYAQVIERFPDAPAASEARLAGAKCLYLAGDQAAARSQLSAIVQAGGPAAVEAGHWLAQSYLNAGQPAEALQAAQQALSLTDESPFRVAVRMDEADALFEQPERRVEATAKYAALAQEFPQDPLAPQALYMAAFSALGNSDYAAAQQYAQAFSQQYASHALMRDVVYVVAESKLLSGNPAEADADYARLLQENPDHADAPRWQVRRGLCLYLQKKYADTAAWLAPLADKLADAALRAEAFFLLGSSLNEQREFPSAVQALNASVQASSDWRQADETLLALAVAQQQTKDLPAALATLKQLLQKFPDGRAAERATFRLGEIAYQSGDPAAAQSAYRGLLEKWPMGALAADTLHSLAWAQLAAGDFAATVTSVDELFSRFPDAATGPRARYARALARQQLQQYGPAVEDLNAFLATNPQPPELSDARYVLGLCQVGLQQSAEAVQTFTQLLEADPQYAGSDKVYYELAWAYRDSNQADAANQAFAKLANDFPNSPLASESWFHVGEQCYGVADYPGAVAAYQKALAGSPSEAISEQSRHKLGWACYKQEQYEQALAAFQEQLAAQPNGSLAGDAAFMAGECLFHLEKYSEALDAYARVTQTSNPEFAALAALHAGQSAAALEQWEQSLQVLQTAAGQFTESRYLPSIVYEQAAALKQLGRLDEALPLFERVTELTDAEVAARARFMVGEIFFEKKDHREAVRHFFKVAFGYSYPVWQANAHYEAGRCFEVLDKVDQAIKSYQEIVTSFPDSDKAALARERLQALQN